MEMREIFGKVAAGLRRMDNKPDFLLFIVQEEWVWDTEKICNIPVYHCSYPYINFKPYSDTECPFIPCWFKPVPTNGDLYNFARGYYEEGDD